MKGTIANAMLCIAVSAVLLGSAGFMFTAQFSDTEASMGNIFQAGTIDLKLGELGSCELAISFLYEDDYEGVDGVSQANPNGWSTNDNMVNLGTNHWDLLGGTADVNAYKNGQTGDLTHRGTRGLGIKGQEDDEIDYICFDEHMHVVFDKPQYLCQFEVRSLFMNDQNTPGLIEEGDVDLMLYGGLLQTIHMTATSDWGTNGAHVVMVDPPVLVDEIVFYIADEDYRDYSEYAVSRIYLMDMECVDGITGSFGTDDIKPGWDPVGGEIWLCNDGLNQGGSLDIGCDYTVTDDDMTESDTDWDTDLHPDEFAEWMQITTMTYYYDGSSVDCLPLYIDFNGNGFFDAQDLKNNPITGLPAPPLGEKTGYLNIAFKLHEDAGNDLQGDTIDITILFTLNQ